MKTNQLIYITRDGHYDEEASLAPLKALERARKREATVSALKTALGGSVKLTGRLAKAIGVAIHKAHCQLYDYYNQTGYYQLYYGSGEVEAKQRPVRDTAPVMAETYVRYRNASGQFVK